MTSPTQLSLAYLRKQGLQVGKVGDFRNYVNALVDLWGFGDLLFARKPDSLAECPAIGIVQCTSGDHHAHRREKIISIPEAKVWLQAGGGILILSWSKKGERGKRKTWQPREEWIVEEDFK